ncbi:MAG: helix-turn-helix domain-containing protein [Amphritea sp.]
MSNSDYLRISRPSPEEIDQETKALMAQKTKNLVDRKGTTPPRGWNKPRYNSPEYHEAVILGWISSKEADSDHQSWEVRSQRARVTTYREKPKRRRNRPAPEQTGQYVHSMSMEVFDDQRLSTFAKTLVIQITALCGKGYHWIGTKPFLAQKMKVTDRTIQRGQSELVEYGYIEKDVAADGKTRMTFGSIYRLTEKLIPLHMRARWKQKKQQAEGVLEQPNWWERLAKPGGTYKTLNNTLIFIYSGIEWKFKCLNPNRYINPPPLFS